VLQELQEELLQEYSKCSKGEGTTEELRGRQGWFRHAHHTGVGAAEGKLLELQGKVAGGAHPEFRGKGAARVISKPRD
jgi:hypothetical protein